LLAPFLKRLPCPEHASAQGGEFDKRRDYFLRRLDLGYIMRILQRGVLSSRTLSTARVQKLIKEAKIHDENKLYTDQVIPFVPIKPEFRGKQEHREDAVDFIIKIIYMIWKL